MYALLSLRRKEGERNIQIIVAASDGVVVTLVSDVSLCSAAWV